MSQLNPESIASRFTEHYGLQLIGSLGKEADGYEYVEFLPAEVHRNESFRIRITIGWRSLDGEFVPGAYAAPIIREMGLASLEKKSVFSGLIGRLREDNATIQMTVNRKPVDPLEPSEWPAQWNSLSIAFRKSPLAVNTEDTSDTENAVLQWGGRFLAAILALAPLEEIETEEHSNPEGLPEGAKIRVEVNRYERSRFNRAACIEILGDSCKACGLNFRDVYGEIGDGYIHVHHITPVSEIGKNYKVDPSKDLVPLCPNCHAMVHRKNPPMTIPELKKHLVRQIGSR